MWRCLRRGRCAKLWRASLSIRVWRPCNSAELWRPGGTASIWSHRRLWHHASFWRRVYSACLWRTGCRNQRSCVWHCARCLHEHASSPAWYLIKCACSAECIHVWQRQRRREQWRRSHAVWRSCEEYAARRWCKREAFCSQHRRRICCERQRRIRRAPRRFCATGCSNLWRRWPGALGLWQRGAGPVRGKCKCAALRQCPGAECIWSTAAARQCLWWRCASGRHVWWGYGGGHRQPVPPGLGGAGAAAAHKHPQPAAAPPAVRKGEVRLMAARELPQRRDTAEEQIGEQLKGCCRWIP